MAKPRVQVKINHTLHNTEEKRDRFISALREQGVVAEACRAAGIARRTAYNWRHKWVTFRQDWDDALEEALDKLELEARSRALDKSDQLLMFLLKAHRPTVYDRGRAAGTLTVETDGDGAARVTIARVAPGVLDAVLDDTVDIPEEIDDGNDG